MSYLRSPRIHFAGRFQADVSTVNNDVRHFDTSTFLPAYQKPMEVADDKIVRYNGYWNPEGTAAWRLLGCRVTAAVLDGRVFTRPDDDPAVGLLVNGAADRVAGKLVDLDPQQQMVSQIWGMAVRLADDRGAEAFRGDYKVAAFTDLWQRQQTPARFLDQQLAAAYQSVLTGVAWGRFAESPTLAALRHRSADGLLSIRFNVFGYDRTPGAPDYGTGVLVGTIGPADADGPRHFTRGRQLTAALDPKSDWAPFAPLNNVSNVQARVDEDAGTVTADFGNALRVVDSAGAPVDIGPLAFGVLKDPQAAQGAVVPADRVVVLGDVPYREAGWMARTAGVQEFRLATRPGAKELARDHPLAVLGVGAGGTYTVLNRETADGVYVRADDYVFRLDPGAASTVEFYATRYGAPLAAAVVTSQTAGLMGGAGTGAKIPGVVPNINTPANGVTYAPSFETDQTGYGTLTVTAAAGGPGNPRGYIDGQVYGVGYQLKDQPAGYTANLLNFVSVLAWDRYDVPDRPTWHGHVRPILAQYANLYPIMSRRLIDLTDYACVVANARLLRLSFSLPVGDPNSMPVTRDLSANKRATLLKWLDSADPATGLPPLGDAPAAPPAAPAPAAEAAFDEPDPGSKAGFVRQALQARRPPHAPN